MVSRAFNTRSGTWWFGVANEDAQIAMQAAHQMAHRLQKPIAVQDDLSVVPADEATKEILEIVKP